MIHIAEQLQSCSSGRDLHGQAAADAAACCGHDGDNGGGGDGGAGLGPDVLSPPVVSLSFGLESY